jgi:hypothetical protein
MKIAWNTYNNKSIEVTLSSTALHYVATQFLDLRVSPYSFSVDNFPFFWVVIRLLQSLFHLIILFFGLFSTSILSR